MYSLRWSYKKVRQRLDALPSRILPSEAYMLTVFMVEKILRRTLLQLIVSAGFTTEQALDISNNIRGLDAIKNNWVHFDPNNCPLAEIVDNSDGQVIKEGRVAGSERLREGPAGGTPVRRFLS